MSEKPLPRLMILARYAIVLSFALVLSVSPSFSYSSSQQEPVMQGQAEYYYQEGKRLVESGDLDRALASFQKALNLEPGMIQAYNQAGIILTINGDIEGAQQMFLRAIAMDSHYADPYSNLGLLYEEEGDYGLALVCWRSRAVLGDSGDPWSEVARKRVQEIAQAYPGIYQAVEEGRITLDAARFTGASGTGTGRQVENAQPVQYDEPKKVSLFREDTLSSRDRSDKRASASDYLARARDFYNRGEFVGALREATIAEYLDPTNPDIASFVQQIRAAILQ